MNEMLLDVDRLIKYFFIDKRQVVKAVDDISLQIYRGETFGLVGESGCGKSTVGRTLIRLYDPTAGKIYFQNQDISRLGGKKLQKVKRKMQMIFQDPYASLNPRMKVGEIIGEGMEIHRLAKGKVKAERVVELLEQVGLKSEHAERFPHEFSGGQRQRIGIARALAVNPEFIIADEPISALDVSVQAQVVNLLKRLQKERGLTYLFIAHDLSMVKYISDRIGVMYLGKLVEVAERNIFDHSPFHPYTRALLSAVPIVDPQRVKKKKRIVLTGEVPSPIHPPSGCPFRTRCPQVMGVCEEKFPDWTRVKPKHWVACHLNA